MVGNIRWWATRVRNPHLVRWWAINNKSEILMSARAIPNKGTIPEWDATQGSIEVRNIQKGKHKKIR